MHARQGARWRCPSAKQLVAENPGDPQYLRTYWLVLRAAKQLEGGDRRPVRRTSPPIRRRRTPITIFRQVADLARRQRVRQGGGDGGAGASRSIPRSAHALCCSRRRTSAMPASFPPPRRRSQRALEIDPKAPGANLLLAQIYVDIGTSRTAPIAAVKARRGGRPDEQGARRAVPARHRQHRVQGGRWHRRSPRTSRRRSRSSRRRTRSTRARMRSSSSACRRSRLLAAAAPAAEDWTCADAKAAEDILTIVSTNMPAGGSVSPEAAEADPRRRAAVPGRSSTRSAKRLLQVSG